MSTAVDTREVVLLKSLRTNNRFYTLVAPESGFKNADAIEFFPPHLPLGIAYPCLEDGLNDFAVIRTTFETIDVFPDDDELRDEMMAIIADARGNLVRRLEELRDRIVEGQAHFLGTDLEVFKDYVVQMATRGTIRRNLDNMMKVDVFESVSKVDQERTGLPPEPMYRYDPLPLHQLSSIQPLPPREFIGRVFDDILDAVTDDANYQNKYSFDRFVFQKFIAVMFVNYATTDPMFYGTNKDDYGVSKDKPMQDTPLYQAVARALRDLERGMSEPGAKPSAPPLELPGEPEQDLSFLFQQPATADDFLQSLQEAGHTVEIPFGAAERMLLDPLTLLADAVRLLKHIDHPRATEVRRMAGNAGRQIFSSLKDLEIISPLASDPLEDLVDD
jgi:hypothetical protein